MPPEEQLEDPWFWNSGPVVVLVEPCEPTRPYQRPVCERTAIPPLQKPD